MAYTAGDHERFSRRMQRFMLRLQSLRDEAAKLVEIYSNETSYGAHAEFVSNDIATKQEHIDGIVLMQALALFVENGTAPQLDRTQTITPFTQSPD